MEAMQTRADLELNTWKPCISFANIIHIPSLYKPGFAPSSINTADNLDSPQASKPRLDLTWSETGLGWFTLANLGRTRFSVCSVNLL